jgi:hypothetical protein
MSAGRSYGCHNFREVVATMRAGGAPTLEVLR